MRTFLKICKIIPCAKSWPMFKIPTEDRNKMAVMKELVEAGKYHSNGLSLKPAPPPLAACSVRRISNYIEYFKQIFLSTAGCFLSNNRTCYFQVVYELRTIFQLSMIINK